ncbi:MAG TPA: DUF4156 domain-containing protein [Nitrosomonas sp.]|nr:DUF4156 domain-containing protein [Nitrosomonas sp.]
MNVSSKLRLLIKTIPFALILISSTAISEKPKTESIMILLGEQNLAECRSLGEIRGSSQNMGEDASYPERLMTARNNLRDETSKLGGNTVLIKHTNNTARYGRYEVPEIDKTIIFIGHAYSCK